MPSTATSICYLEPDRRLPLHARSGISLHAHTFYSQETLGFVPNCAAALPVISRLFDAELRRHRDRAGETIDFTSGYWRPPLSPAAVLASERAQIEERLALDALVSVTDHDSIKAGLMLCRAGEPVPISVEWTMPFRTAFLHIGIHNVPLAQATGVMRQLVEYARHPVASRLGDLLEWLGSSPETLMVLNHPFWDLEGSGAVAHERLVLDFLQDHRHQLHALELNGMQIWENNRRTLVLAETLGLPVVSGGDRHGRAPNAMLNVTSAATFPEFVHEVRESGRSHIVITPAYRHALLVRRLETAGDILRTYPDHPAGRPRWADRVCYERRPGTALRLSAHWPDGGPTWLRLIAYVLAMLMHPRLQPAWRLACRSAPEVNTWEPRHEWRSLRTRSMK